MTAAVPDEPAHARHRGLQVVPDMTPEGGPQRSWRRMREGIVAGQEAAVRRQHALGKRTARERLDLLLDKDSFTEIDLYRRHHEHRMGMELRRPHTDGVIAGSGTIDGRRVFVYAQDFTVFGGSLGQAHASKIHKVMDLALATGAPIIALNDSGGARIQEGVLALHGYGGIFRRQVQASRQTKRRRERRVQADGAGSRSLASGMLRAFDWAHRFCRRRESAPEQARCFTGTCQGNAGLPADWPILLLNSLPT